jgi:predicted transcriptional regulator
VLEIRARYALGGIKQADLAKEFGVSQANIGVIIRRETWFFI